MNFKKIFFALFLALIATSFVLVNHHQPKPVSKKTSTKKKPTVKKIPKTKTPNVKKDSLIWYDMTSGHAKALKEKKPIMIDVYTDWCYWCKVMDKETFTDSAVKKYMIDNYVCIKWNPEKNVMHNLNGQIYSNQQLLGYLVNGGHFGGYPTFFVWSNPSDVKTNNIYPGYRAKEEFLTILKKHNISEGK